MPFMRAFHVLVFVAICLPLMAANAGRAQAEADVRPRPGEVYREYTAHNGGNRDWRITDPNATPEGARAFLPNPVLKIQVDDLEHAIRAEAVIDRWGGHLRTSEKRIRFNANPWLTIPEISTTPNNRPEYYYSQDNPIVEVPLEHLKEGANTFEGTCGVLENYNWGQWGLYSLILRVYYDPQRKEYPTGRIVSPVTGGVLEQSPRISVHPEAGQGVARVDVLAWFDGYDEDGDGVFQQWHGSYHQPLRGASAGLSEHVGTMWRAPYELTWDTTWVPDQKPESVKLVARVQDSDGMWSVTPVVDRLTLQRPEYVVRLYKAAEVPERFGVRVGRTSSCGISIPEDAPLDRAEAAVLALRTWHGWDGHHSPLNLNGTSIPISGKNHHYDFDLLPIPTKSLRPGQNRFQIHSPTEHHMLEVLWPGPAVLVRYTRKR